MKPTRDDGRGVGVHDRAIVLQVANAHQADDAEIRLILLRPIRPQSRRGWG
jgi:hypothetical protein